MQPPSAHYVAAELLAWYRAHQRDLPWRSDPTPYHVLLSELMLQQTRVETVIPYFERFTTRWPDLQSLAAADEEEVLRAWSGLGYYRRVRNLLHCAREAVGQGGLPRGVDELRALPGIGPYTAGAVASIAFGVSTPVVDGNVERVISRLDARPEDPRASPGRQAIWTRVADLHGAAPPGSHPGDLNQALMELGATVCTPRGPRCGACPVAGACLARRGHQVEAFPAARARRKPTAVRAVCGLMQADGGVVMGRRPEGLLGGLWEPIGTELVPKEEPMGALRTAFAERAGLEVRVQGYRGEVVHVFTHRRLTCAVYDVVGEGVARVGVYYTDVRVIADPETVPLSALARRILALAPQLGLPLAAEGP